MATLPTISICLNKDKLQQNYIGAFVNEQGQVIDLDWRQISKESLSKEFIETGEY